MHQDNSYNIDVLLVKHVWMTTSMESVSLCHFASLYTEAMGGVMLHPKLPKICRIHQKCTHCRNQPKSRLSQILAEFLPNFTAKKYQLSIISGIGNSPDKLRHA